MVKRSTVFASGYSGFEMLGTNGGTLTFAWRGDNNLANPGWHGPGSVLVNGDPLQGVRGRPGFLQYPTYVPGQSQPVWQFLALVPQDMGGVGLYERVEPGPFDWGTHLFGVIARQLGLIDSVTAVMTGSGGLVAVVQAGSRLYELSHARGHLPADFGTGWSPPTEVRTAGGGGISVIGDAELINATSRPGGTHLDLAIPVRDGLVLLTAATATNQWTAERLPVHQQVDSVTLLGGEVDGRPNTDIIYRSGSHLFNIWKWDNGTWHQPTLARWGSPP